MDERPKVGVGVIIIKDGKILLGKRKNSHSEGDWSYPGGHLEYGESWEDCARREVMEEVGIQIKNLCFGTVTNDLFIKANKHCVTICMISDFASGKIKTLEPDRCEGWEWFTWGNFSQPLIPSIANQILAGFNPFNEPKNTHA